MSRANDSVCYACGAPLGEHQVDTLACPWGGRAPHLDNMSRELLAALLAVLPNVAGWNVKDFVGRSWLVQAQAAIDHANGRVTHVPLFQECVFQPLPERELVLTHGRELYELEEEGSI